MTDRPVQYHLAVPSQAEGERRMHAAAVQVDRGVPDVLHGRAGKSEWLRVGLVGDLIVGCIGALLGGFLFRLLGIATTGMLGDLICATIGAIVLLFLLRVAKRNM